MTMIDHHSDILILGSGAAGCTAAIYAARANRRPIVISGSQPGGQLTITTDVENFPGFADMIQGPWLMEQMQKQAEHVGARFVNDTIEELECLPDAFVCRGESGVRYHGRSLIVATGASARWLGLESERRYRGYGVSACATCDGFFFRNKHVAVVGGGNTAVEEAIYLTNHAAKVTLIHRRDILRAERIAQQRLLANAKIEVCWNSEVDEILGDPERPEVTALRLKDTVTGGFRDLPVDGVFIAIGHSPNTSLFAGRLDLDEDGYIVTKPGSTVTSRAGVFAAGDVQDRHFRQAVTAAGSGCMSALEAERFLLNTTG
ncbi:thioredoxin-disulfide reductase [Xanthobacter pseudotagetidis]|uniref:thioredoxin-disulfide reductase n=1 Tax=Xanthobacter pseudotagetidis TaxID=3119911 RepID=UPI0037285466